MSKTVRVKLSVEGMDRAIREIRMFKKRIISKIPKFVEQLAEEGYKVASIRFSTAQYDGTNDVRVSIEEGNGQYSKAVVAMGCAVLFIEFGTGVYYPADHPDPLAASFPHGDYGHGQGQNIWGWTYKGERGTNGISTTRGLVHTLGNPANACLYRAREEVGLQFESIARKVFADG